MAQKEAIIAFDRYRWSEGDPPNIIVHEAARGQKVSVSDDEFKRGEAMGALVAASSKRGKELADAGPRYAISGGPSLEGAPGAAPRAEFEKLDRDDLVQRAKDAGIDDAESMGDAELIDALQGAGAIGVGPATPAP